MSGATPVFILDALVVVEMVVPARIPQYHEKTIQLLSFYHWR